MLGRPQFVAAALAACFVGCGSSSDKTTGAPSTTASGEGASGSGSRGQFGIGGQPGNATSSGQFDVTSTTGGTATGVQSQTILAAGGSTGSFHGTASGGAALGAGGSITGGHSSSDLGGSGLSSAGAPTGGMLPGIGGGNAGSSTVTGAGGSVAGGVGSDVPGGTAQWAGGVGAAGQAGWDKAPAGSGPGGSGGHGTAGSGSAGVAGSAGADGCPASGSVVYVLSGAETWPQDVVTRITAAMDEAVWYYNCYSNLSHYLTVDYRTNPDLTAQANVDGWMTFGPNPAYMVLPTAMHEIGHTMGVGYWPWRDELAEDGHWIGRNVVEFMASLTPEQTDPDAADYITADAMHFWPYGLNYASEYVSEWSLINHVRVVAAMNADKEAYRNQ